MHIAEQSESDLDDDGELVDQMFGLTNFNENSEFDTKHAEKLLAKYQAQLNKHSDKDLEEMLKEEKEAATGKDAEAIEAFINETKKDD